jgi:ribosomal protein S12 methylthiotransferase accessory factor YcaO
MDLAGWPVVVTTYRLEATYYTTVENTDPGAWIVKGKGATRQEAETRALKEAESLLAKVKKMPPPTGCTSVPRF